MVKFDGIDISEVEKFYYRYFNEDNEFFEDAESIFALIEYLSIHGIKAIKKDRPEAGAFALPPKSMEDECEAFYVGNNLRLYYVQIAPSIVLLLGGGIAHDSDSGRPPIQLQEAQMFVKKVKEGLNVSYTISGNKLVSTDSEEIIIY
ncbi:hypothetical protein SAMN05443550_113133 [Pedobacter hartonius]|uniref:Uncharacterized protein n=2 Tax=Pedobacter hartonius TaxID=425514 RepID=A0A1H4H7J6_9SPHI|nr:hypothetical protein SAMN05443550_113133 [Pedobacter hartonius]